MESVSRRPIDFFGGMMNGVITPEPGAMKEAMIPVQQEVRQQQIGRNLPPEGQRPQRAAAVAEVVAELVLAHEGERKHRQRHQKPHPHERRQRLHDQPITDIGHKPGIAPPHSPRVTGLAGEQAQRAGDGHHQDDTDKKVRPNTGQLGGQDRQGVQHAYSPAQGAKQREMPIMAC